MNFDKKATLKILFIIFVSILFLTALLNIEMIFGWVGNLLSVLTPVIIGLCLAFVINIPMKLIEDKCFAPLNKKFGRRWKKLRRPLALLCAILFFVLVIAILLVIIIPQFVEAVDGFVVALPGYMDALNGKITDIYTSLTGKETNDLIQINWETVSGMITEFMHKNDSDTVTITLNVITGAINAVFDLVLGIVFSIYILASKEKLGKQARSIFYSIFKKDKIDKVLSVMSLANSSFSRFIVGQFTEAIIIGVLCAIGMLIFQFPYVPIISCVIAITALIPVFGAFIGTGLGAFMILLVSPMKALWFIIFIIVLQQLETNIIYPKVVGKSVGLPGIWVLFAVTVGGGFFGALGMLVAVPICSVLYTLLDIWVRSRLIQRNINTDTLLKKHSHPASKNKSRKSSPDNPGTSEDNTNTNNNN